MVSLFHSVTGTTSSQFNPRVTAVTQHIHFPYEAWAGDAVHNDTPMLDGNEESKSSLECSCSTFNHFQLFVLFFLSIRRLGLQRPG